MLQKRFSLEGKTALVTGSSRGIGAAIAVGLAEAGADVIVHCSTNRPAADAVAERIRAFGRRCHVIQADLAADGAPQRIVAPARQAFSAIDILVLNASVQFRRAWNEPNPAEFDNQVAINLRSTVELIQLLTPSMIERGWGRVLTIGSVQQYRPHSQMMIYASLKSAVENITRNLARQLSHTGVTFNNISPGIIETDRNTEALSDPQRRQAALAAVPMGRFGQAEDCVGAALLLCSDAGSYITGIDLPVDGGLRLP